METNFNRRSSTLLPRLLPNIPSQHPPQHNPHSIVLKILTASFFPTNNDVHGIYNFHGGPFPIDGHLSGSFKAYIATSIKCLWYPTAGDRSSGHLIRVPRIFSCIVSRICTIQAVISAP